MALTTNSIDTCKNANIGSVASSAVTAVIPCRGGSKRIPRKNIKKMKGTPLFVYSISKAVESKLFDKIIVTTDDKKIAEEAEKYGATIHIRKKVSDKQTLKEVWGMFPKPLCCILPNPLTKVSDIVEASKIPYDVWSVIEKSSEPPVFQDAGQFYWIRGEKRIFYEVRDAVDINLPSDWKLAESKL